MYRYMTRLTSGSDFSQFFGILGCSCQGARQSSVLKAGPSESAASTEAINPQLLRVKNNRRFSITLGAASHISTLF